MAIVLPAWQIAYFPAPKVACTSLKQMFFQIENGVAFRPLVRNGQMFHIHNFYGTAPFKAHDPGAIRDYWRIAVFRDPLSRFLSCYSNRVLHHRELAPGILSATARAAGAVPDPDLETFVERLEIYREHSASIRHHTDPQVSFLGREAGYFHRLYRMDELPQLVRDLSRRLDMPLELPHDQRGGPRMRASDLSPNAREKLLRFYRADLRRLGPAAGLGQDS